MNNPDWFEKCSKLLCLVGRFVSLAGQVLSLYGKFDK
jgi:hypothetical protein